MDDATENLDIVPDAADSENLNLDNSAEFNLDDVLNNSGTDSSEVLLNLAGEEESTADLNMEDWLAGITPGGETPAAGDIDLPKGEDVAETLAGDVGESSELSEFDNTELDELPEAAADDANVGESNDFSETEADVLSGTGSWPAEDGGEELNAAPTEGNGWLAETETEPESESELETESVAFTEEAYNAEGNSWLAEPEPESADIDMTGEEAPGESAAVSDSWQHPEEITEDATAAGAEFSDALNEENNVEGVPADESAVLSESSWLSSEGETAFEENGTDINAEISADDGAVSGLDEAIPAAESVSGTAENGDVIQPQEICGTEPNFVKWYSGSVHDEMFEISKNELPPEIEGSANNNIIHINVGYDTYGWLAEFDNGLVMSLEDVRKYQIRNGVLPAASGVIRYGANQCRFSNIERILIYQSVRYFSYGA